MHFCQSFVSVSKEHQSKLAHDQVKTAIWEWKVLRRADTPSNRESLSLGGCAAHVEHVGIEVEAADCSLRSTA
jgi:hypothetical protein